MQLRYLVETSLELDLAQMEYLDWKKGYSEEISFAYAGNSLGSVAHPELAGKRADVPTRGLDRELGR
jgi:hypothetical protein